MRRDQNDGIISKVKVSKVKVSKVIDIVKRHSVGLEIQKCSLVHYSIIHHNEGIKIGTVAQNIQRIVVLSQTNHVTISHYTVFMSSKCRQISNQRPFSVGSSQLLSDSSSAFFIMGMCIHPSIDTISPIY